jgi:predicted ATPase/class 3 adenylate cyclase
VEASTRSLPQGTVTFLFTDIEGSTKLLHELGTEAYADALAEHRRALREAFAQHGGVEVDTQGDAFFVAFERASDALAAAAAAQTALASMPLDVRMGVHTGEPLVTGEGYVGLDVHRAARIAAAGHGGQVLVSQAARDLAGLPLRDLGEHRLKDLSAPERIYQLGDGEFAPLKTLYATNLPVPTTPFLGRRRELEELASLIARARLVTVTGAGGSGKTRLALQAAADAVDSFPAGVWWVALAAVAEPGDVLPAAARALGAPGPLEATIGDRRLLLVLDNFEQVVGAAADVERLLAACPGLTIVVTSRERLRVAAEQVYAVPLLERSDAIALFTARAQANDPSFVADEHVAELCARLDDLPLAIELAAARVGVMSTEQLSARLSQRLDLLRGGRDAEARQATLRATVAWSYDLLDEEERRLLASLSVFRGGFSLEAAEQVCGARVDVLESLVDKSLVRGWGGGRFGMLETIREFAAERAAADVDRAGLLEALLAWMLDLAEQTNLSATATGPQRHELVREERGNIDAAVEYAAAQGRFDVVLELMSRLENYWVTADPLAVGRWTERVIAEAGDSLEPRLRGFALQFRGAFFDMTSQHDLGAETYLQAEEAYRAAGEEGDAMHVRHRRAFSALQGGDVERAASFVDELLAYDRANGRTRDEAIATALAAHVAYERGDAKAAMHGLRESARLAAESGFAWWRALMLGELANVLLDEDATAAQPVVVDAVEAIRAVGDRVNIPTTLLLGTRAAAARGDASTAGFLLGQLDAGERRELLPLWRAARHAAADAVAGLPHDVVERARVEGAHAPIDEAFARITRGSR